MQPELSSTKFWTLQSTEVLTLLGTTGQGLSEGEVIIRNKHYGSNSLSNKSHKGPFSIFLTQLKSPLLFILFFAGIISLYLGERIEAVVIFLSVLVNIFFGFYQEYKAEHTIEKLASYIKNTARVIRNNSMRTVDASELVPGDIISIEYGSRISADARIIESTGLKIDESILTGESLPVEKTIIPITAETVSDRTNCVHTGTYVVSGIGLAVVTHTGNHTEIGKIAASVAETKRVLTPVQTAVKQISWYIFSIALVIITIVFVLGIIRGESIFEMLLLSSAVAVGAVPEALPITLTVILSVGALFISKKGGLIRALAATETLGSTTLILTDKTGTLTVGELSLDAIYPLAELLQPELPEISPITKETLSTTQKELLLLARANTSGIVEKKGDDPTKWSYTGSAFDQILLKSIHTLGISDTESDSGKLISPFNSTKKYSLATQGNHVSVLGAPDILIKSSTLSLSEQELLLSHLLALSNQGKRLIAFGTTENSSLESMGTVTLMGLFTFSDALRPEATPAIAAITSQGIAVKIITGDLPGTARFIAHQVGLSVSDGEIITGTELNNITDDDLKKLLPHIKLFARVTPEDKLRIGKLYRSMGEIVAMTGDGVNDAPALKAMDIGISLASASDVAKSAADMILLDNNFRTITDTISEGHKIRANIQKVFVYLMSSSLDEVFVIAGALIAGLALPLNALQIIWVNMLTGTLPALAFAYDNHRPEHRQHSTIFDFRVKFLALGIGTFSSLLLFVLYFILMKIMSPELARTVFFACFATYILSVSYSFKNIEKLIISYNPFSNMRLNIANLIGFALIIITLYSPIMQQVFDLTTIPFALLWIIVIWNIGNIILVELAKYIIIRFGRFV